MTDPDQWRDVVIGNSSVPVRRGSILEAAFGDVEELPGARRMQWSLGIFADLLWMLVPESREELASLVRVELEEAISEVREVQAIPMATVVREGFWETLFEPVLRGFPETVEDVRRYLSFVRVVWEFDDRDSEAMREDVQDVVLEALMVEPYVGIFAQVDPEFYSAVCGQLKF